MAPMHKYTVGRSPLARNRGCQAAIYAKPGLITARRPAVADQTALLSCHTELGFLRTSQFGPQASSMPCNLSGVPGHRWRLLALTVTILTASARRYPAAKTAQFRCGAGPSRAHRSEVIAE
jgi:hypothetical protein